VLIRTHIINIASYCLNWYYTDISLHCKSILAQN